MASASSHYDITLKCGGKRFPANLKLLEASSDYFASLVQRRISQKIEVCSEVSLLDDVSTTGLTELLLFIHSQPSTLSLDTVDDVLKAADFLGVAEVTRTCKVFLSGSLEPATVFGISGLARDYMLEGLEAECKDMVLDRFQEVAATGELLLLEFPELLAALRDDRLVVSGEGEVWEAALAWLKAGGQGGRWQHMEQILATVRYGLMDYSYFQERVRGQGPLEVKENLAVQDLLQQADNYLAVMSRPTRQLADELIKKHGSTPHFATPRLPKTFLFTIVVLNPFTEAPSISMEVYDSNSNHWSKVKLELPLGLHDCTAQSVGEKVYMMGGYSVDPLTQRSVLSSQTFIVDVTKSTVECSVPMKEERDGATSAVVDNTIYIFGGEDEDRRLKSCEKLDTSQLPLKWEKTRPLEVGRTGAGAAAVGGRVYLCGGRTDTGEILTSVQVYDTELDVWEDGPRMTVARYVHGCVAHGDTVYVAGGSDGNGAMLASVERLLPGAAEWERVADMLQPRAGLALVTMDGKIYAVAGSNRSVEVFDPERITWTEVSGLPEVKFYMATVTVERRQLGEAAQRSYGSDRRGELMERDLARGLARGQAE